MKSAKRTPFKIEKIWENSPNALQSEVKKFFTNKVTTIVMSGLTKYIFDAKTTLTIVNTREKILFLRFQKFAKFLKKKRLQ